MRHEARRVGPSSLSQRSARGDGYDLELRVLQPARSALAQGDFNSALAAIARHKGRFPAGKLAEEREALRVKALLGLGRDDAARAAAADFRNTFPDSVLLPSVEALFPRGLKQTPAPPEVLLLEERSGTGPHPRRPMVNTAP